MRSSLYFFVREYHGGINTKAYIKLMISIYIYNIFSPYYNDYSLINEIHFCIPYESSHQPTNQPISQYKSVPHHPFLLWVLFSLYHPYRINIISSSIDHCTLQSLGGYLRISEALHDVWSRQRWRYNFLSIFTLNLLKNFNTYLKKNWLLKLFAEGPLC